MSNKLYLIAASRNIKLTQATGSGLYANVGMTHGRSVSERLWDPHYRKKQLGGTIEILNEWAIGELKDHAIHMYLKEHDEVEWDSASHNTEEFLFLTDDGDGKRATEIIEAIIAKHYVPSFLTEKLSIQQSVIESLQEQVKDAIAQREKVENAEPWQIMQEQISIIERDFEEKLGEAKDDLSIRIENMAEEVLEVERDLETKYQAKYKRKVHDSAKRIERIEAECASTTKKRTRLCILFSLLSLTSIGALGLDVSDDYFTAQVEDKQSTIEELQDDLKEATVKKRIATRNSESLEKKVERLENEKIKKIEAEKVKKTKKAAVSKRKKNVDKICVAASECTFDAKADNVIHCSIYQKGTRYRCSVILNERVTGYHREGRTVTLADGHASVWSNSSMFSYSVAKIGSRY